MRPKFRRGEIVNFKKYPNDEYAIGKIIFVHDKEFDISEACQCVYRIKTGTFYIDVNEEGIRELAKSPLYKIGDYVLFTYGIYTDMRGEIQGITEHDKGYWYTIKTDGGFSFSTSERTIWEKIKKEGKKLTDVAHGFPIKPDTVYHFARPFKAGDEVWIKGKVAPWEGCIKNGHVVDGKGNLSVKYDNDDSNITTWVNIENDVRVHSKFSEVSAPKNKWISIKDKLPNNEEIVNVFTPEKKQYIAKFDENRMTFTIMAPIYLYVLTNVTHWKPLDEPPDE